MNSRINLQQFKRLVFVQGLFVLLFLTTGKASATGTDATVVDIKDTNYPIPSGAYFVSPDGLDTNSGKSLNSPWSVTKALSLAPDGATIVFRGGTYRNIKEASIRKRLTLQAYPHEKAWLKGSVIVSGWVADGNIWRKDGWTYSFPSTQVSSSVDPNYPMSGYGDMVYINGISLEQVGSKAEVVPGTFYVDPSNDQLYIGDNPAGKTVESTAQAAALSLWKGGSNNPSGTVIRGLGIAQYAITPVKIGVPNVTLENNTIVWNGSWGVYFFAGANDGIIRGNNISYNAEAGAGGSSAARMLLENNIFSYNNIEHFAKTWSAAGAKFIEADSLVARNNLFEHNYANGLWCDISCTNATIVNNTVRDNEGLGIFYEVSHMAIIAGNLAYNNIVGVMLSNSSSGRVYNNTLVNNSIDFVIKDTGRNNTNSAEIADGITWIARDIVFKNNILSNAQGSTLFDASNCGTKESSAKVITGADNNAYYRTSSSKPSSLIKWSLSSGKCSVGYNSINALSSATGYERHSLSVDNVSTNPFFVDEANGDYRLKSGSPAIGRGAPLPADIANAIGLPAGVPVDLGAIQR